MTATDRLHRRLRRLDALSAFSIVLLLGSFALLATIILTCGMTLDWSGLGTCIAFSIAALAAGIAMKLAGGTPRVADLLLVVAVMAGATVCNTLSMNVGLRLHMPLIDAGLVASDHVLGFDPAMLVRAFALSPRITEWLGIAYTQSNWAAIAVVLGRCLMPDPDWRPFVAYSGGLLAASVISVVTPAMGNIAYSHLFDLQGHGLPYGAGTYHLDAFRYYYHGTAPIAGNAHISGVGVFPSFHTIMGLVIATGLRGTRFHLAGAAFGIATIVATIPMGSHYVTDIVGGTVIWALAMGLAQLGYRAGRRADAGSGAGLTARASQATGGIEEAIAA
ncbi:phosphatase PAP2 family protein [Novosphingobium resinovorum]|uniref:phosphatase PAP2 family protein n=1 Tax=Novosphingobium resinovorum TaxID=158500 RepID=UPI002ECFD282|nr:phosphatase PAP2 family protein [Novosphingobium resinovorum]